MIRWRRKCRSELDGGERFADVELLAYVLFRLGSMIGWPYATAPSVSKSFFFPTGGEVLVGDCFSSLLTDDITFKLSSLLEEEEGG